ncbi:putative nuclease HARBI1 [Littorina saxatilis]|uniref:putative nuclease HARBI1 n=1 Tax=Littorina saxatilis TaxID=31220 RepID=UPI0038B67C8A
MYDQLMVELRYEDHASFTNFLRISPAMFDELLVRVGPRITKQYTFYRDPLEPGMNDVRRAAGQSGSKDNQAVAYTFYRDPLEPGMTLALTLRHHASGNKYASMKFGWRVPHNTQSLVVREVCQAIIDEYVDEELVCPSTPESWRAVADKFFQRWNFPNTCGALDGKHVACRCPPNSGSLYFNYKGFYSIVLMALVDADYKFIWADISGTGSASDAQIYNSCELKECVP